MAGREGGNEVLDTRVVYGGPRGGADVSPEFVSGGERAQLGRCTAGGGESRAVEAGEDVGLDDVGMDGGDRGGTAVINGCRRSRSHK